MEAHVNHPSAAKEMIDELINALGANDPAERNNARDNLIEIGQPAVQALIELTTRPETELRREAAFVLGEIQDPASIPTLIDLLVDKAFEVRWRAAESLIKMKRNGVIPLFKELLQKDRFGSVWFLEGVHHILRKLDEEGYLGLPSQKVLAAFADPVREIAIPTAAEKALEAFKTAK